MTNIYISFESSGCVLELERETCLKRNFKKKIYLFRTYLFTVREISANIFQGHRKLISRVSNIILLF